MDVYECQGAALPATASEALGGTEIGGPKFVRLWVVAESLADVEELLFDCEIGWPHEFRFEEYRMTDTALGAALLRLAPTDRPTMYACALPAYPDNPVVRIDSETEVQRVAVIGELPL